MGLEFLGKNELVSSTVSHSSRHAIGALNVPACPRQLQLDPTAARDTAAAGNAFVYILMPLTRAIFTLLLSIPNISRIFQPNLPAAAAVAFYWTESRDIYWWCYDHTYFMSSAKNKPQIPSVKSKIKAQGEELSLIPPPPLQISLSAWPAHLRILAPHSGERGRRECRGVCVWLVLLICLAFHGTSESRNYA